MVTTPDEPSATSLAPSMKPRSVVFDLFGDHLRYHGGAARTPVLVELLDVFVDPPSDRAARGGLACGSGAGVVGRGLEVGGCGIVVEGARVARR